MPSRFPCIFSIYENDREDDGRKSKRLNNFSQKIQELGSSRSRARSTFCFPLLSFFEEDGGETSEFAFPLTIFPTDNLNGEGKRRKTSSGICSYLLGKEKICYYTQPRLHHFRINEEDVQENFQWNRTFKVKFGHDVHMGSFLVQI